MTSTVGASFLTKRVVDDESDTVVRLQIWDTAGQERFRYARSHSPVQPDLTPRLFPIPHSHKLQDSEDFIKLI